MDKACCVVLLFLGLVSCHSERGGIKGSQGTKVFEIEENEFSTLDTLKGLKMWLVPNSFEAGEPDKMIKCVLRNDTEYELSFGSKYAVERWDGKRWVLLPFISNFLITDELYGMSPKGGIDGMDLCLSKCLVDGAQERGRHRLTIGVGLSHEIEAKFRVSAEFTVE